MTRIRLTAVGLGVLFGLLVTLMVSSPRSAHAAEKWVTIKGQVVWPASKQVPAREPLTVTADKAHCLMNGPLLSEELLIKKENRGVQNVWVYLKPESGDSFDAADINPELAKMPPKQIVLDQPCCMFIPRVFAARQGDTLLVKNSSPVAHNINYSSDNLSFNQTIPAGGSFKPDKPLEAQRGPHVFACNIHPWMGGRAMVFDNPYFAVTDENGKFEIKGVPAKNLRIFYRHELGYHKGRDGNKGFPLTVKGNGPVMELPPLEIDLNISK